MQTLRGRRCGLTKGKLTAKQEAFCRAYRDCGEAGTAYERSFKIGRMKPATVERRARALLAMPAVMMRLGELGGQVSRVDQRWVIERLVENVERAMTAVPATDRQGQPTGVYSYQGAVANRALFLLGKALGLFTEPLQPEDGEDDLNPEQTRERLAKRIAGLLSDPQANGASEG